LLKIIPALVLCLCTSLVSAQVHEYVLNNGLKLLVKVDSRAPVVVSQVWYKVGSSYEYDGITGISHALEHMMFKGTRKHGEGEFSRIIAENGGSENAFTGDDYTAYFQTMEKSRLRISFELEADRMRNLIVNQAALDKEMEVVKEERRLRTEDNPGSYMREVAMATAYQTSPYRQPIIGWMADLENVRIDQFRDWYKQWYAPNNATVVVVGDVVPDEVHTLAKKYFGPLRRETITPPAHRPEVPQNGIKRVVVKRAAEVPQITMAYKTPGLLTSLTANTEIELWEPYALEVLSGILSGGSSARFESRLVRAQEVSSGVGSSYKMSGRLDGLFTIGGTPAQGKTIEELELAIRQEIEDLQNNEVTEQELKRVKAQVVSSEVYERDSAFFQGMILGMYETVGLGWRLAEEYVERVNSVTPAQIQAVARKYLVDDVVTIAVLEPLPLNREGSGQTSSVSGGRHAP